MNDNSKYLVWGQISNVGSFFIIEIAERNKEEIKSAGTLFYKYFISSCSTSLNEDPDYEVILPPDFDDEFSRSDIQYLVTESSNCLRF